MRTAKDQVVKQEPTNRSPDKGRLTWTFTVYSVHFFFFKFKVCIKYFFQVEDNVCYRSLGHSYFLEDGSEMYNTFDGNIAIGTLPGQLIPTDM